EPQGEPPSATQRPFMMPAPPRNWVRMAARAAIILVLPLLILINVRPGIADLFSTTDLVILGGGTALLLLAALRTQLMERNSQLHDAIADRERLFSVIGHDLRGPIGVLKSYLDLMIEGDLDREDFREVQHDLRKGV